MERKEEERFIEVKRTAAYRVLGKVKTPSKSLTLGCHGYGQLATYIPSKFRCISTDDHAIVSAEGLNKFYWKGVSGDPVATWMTKKNRLHEINDFSGYLNLLYKQYFTNPDAKKVFLGFSQGGTTLWRWIHRCQPDFDIFINWAGWIPEDIDLTILEEYLNGKQLIFIYGIEDEYLTEERINRAKEIIESNRLNIQVRTFDGSHKIDAEILKDLYDELL